jgi:hypothetical protein
VKMGVGISEAVKVLVLVSIMAWVLAGFGSLLLSVGVGLRSDALGPVSTQEIVCNGTVG